MYTYERLIQLCRQEDNDSAIAQYLLNHLDVLERLTLAKMIRDTGISKASIHRFYSKGGYGGFRDLTSVLNGEIKQKRLNRNQYEEYKDKQACMMEDVTFNDKQIHALIKTLKTASRAAFYGNTLEIMSMRSLQFYMYTHHIAVDYLDRWDLNSCRQIVKNLKPEDVFIIVESSWRVQSIYEYSMNTPHMLNLDVIHELPFEKFYIGEANTEKFLSYQNIGIPHNYNGMSKLSLNLLDQKIASLL